MSSTIFETFWKKRQLGKIQGKIGFPKDIFGKIHGKIGFLKTF